MLQENRPDCDQYWPLRERTLPEDAVVDVESEYEDKRWELVSGPARYWVGKKFAEGGMADLYLAQDRHFVDPDTDRGLARAVKVIKSKVFRDPDLRHLLSREARIMAKIDYPGVVKVYDYIENEIIPGHPLYRDEEVKLPMIVMEYMDPQKYPTLKKRIENGIPVQEIPRIIDSLAQTVDYMGSQGILHQDLKPGNIFISEDQTKISDFGISSGEVSGCTPEYASPEKARGEEINLQSEIFSLAIIAYEMLTGERPFLDKRTHEIDSPMSVLYAIANSPFKPLRGSRYLERQGIDTRALQGVFTNAFEKHSADRYRTAQEFAEDLRSVLENSKPANRIAPGLRRFKFWGRGEQGARTQIEPQREIKTIRE